MVHYEVQWRLRPTLVFLVTCVGCVVTTEPNVVMPQNEVAVSDFQGLIGVVYLPELATSEACVRYAVGALPYPEVIVRTSQAGVVVSEVLTNSAGRFSVPLPPGTYDLALVPPHAEKDTIDGFEVTDDAGWHITRVFWPEHRRDEAVVSYAMSEQEYATLEDAQQRSIEIREAEQLSSPWRFGEDYRLGYWVWKEIVKNDSGLYVPDLRDRILERWEEVEEVAGNTSGQVCEAY